MVKHIFLFFLIIFSYSNTASAEKEKPVLTNGWYQWSPYQYSVENEGLKTLTGLDVTLVQKLTEKTGREVKYSPVSWKEHQDQLRDGTRDFAAGATYTDARAKFVYFSEPYRFEENSMFTNWDNVGTLEFNNISEFLQQIRENNFKLAVIDGYIYADPSLNDFIKDPVNADLITKTGDDHESMKLLMKGEVSGFLADKTVGANMIWKTKMGQEITEVPLNIKVPIHLMFSKKAVPFSVVEEFNKAIKSYVGSNEYNTIVTEYLAPVMFLKTVDSPWFRIVETIGTIAFALSGVMIAFQQRATLLAAFLFSFLPSFGGGIVRDVLFGITPVYILRAPIYFLIVAGIVVGSYLISHYAGNKVSRFFDALIPAKLKKRKENFYLVLTDSMGLAAFTVSGVFVTLVAKVEPFWLWAPFFALLTSVAGGIIRDILARRDKIVAFSGAPYGEWAIIWGFAFSMYLYFNAINISQEIVAQGIIVTILGVFFSRVIVYLLNINNLTFKDIHKK